jgi:hypothetical protein
LIEQLHGFSSPQLIFHIPQRLIDSAKL